MKLINTGGSAVFNPPLCPKSLMLRYYSESLAKKGMNICDPSLAFNSTVKWPCPDGYSVTEYRTGSCSMEIIKKGSGNINGNVIYYLHGGGYTLPLTNAYRDTAVMLSGMTQDTDIVLLDYRTAPQHIFPAALEDAVSGWNKMAELGYIPGRTVICGDSAGGNLSLALTAKLRNEGMKLPCSLALMSAWADLAGSGESYTRNVKKDPMFGINRYYRTPDHRIAETCAGSTPLDDPLLSPAYGSFEGFPPMFMQVATDEMLYSDTETVCRKAAESGVDVTAQAYKGLFHCFQVIYRDLPESRIAWKDLTDFINKTFA